MTEKMVLKKSLKTSRWIKGRDSGGMCYTQRWDEIYRAVQAWRKAKGDPSCLDEAVVGLRIEQHGVTFFVEKIGND